MYCIEGAMDLCRSRTFSKPNSSLRCRSLDGEWISSMEHGYCEDLLEGQEEEGVAAFKTLS